MAMDYNAPQNVSGELVSELFKKGRKTALFSSLVAKIKHIDTRIRNGYLRIQGWIPLSSFILDYPKNEDIEMSFSISKEHIGNAFVTIMNIQAWAIPLWHFHKPDAYEVARKIPHDVLTENDFKL